MLAECGGSKLRDGWLRGVSALDGRDSLLRDGSLFEFAPLEFAPRELAPPAVSPFDELLNEWNPSFELPRLVFALARLASDADTFASLGDMAGAWYEPPAFRAATAEWLLKSPAREVAAIAGRP